LWIRPLGPDSHKYLLLKTVKLNCFRSSSTWWQRFSVVLQFRGLNIFHHCKCTVNKIIFHTIQLIYITVLLWWSPQLPLQWMLWQNQYMLPFGTFVIVRDVTVIWGTDAAAPRIRFLIISLRKLFFDIRYNIYRVQLA